MFNLQQSEISVKDEEEDKERDIDDKISSQTPFFEPSNIDSEIGRRQSNKIKAPDGNDDFRPILGDD